MAEEVKCLRNMNCKCPQCGGFDVRELLSITQSISSGVKYDDEGAPPPPATGGLANSPRASEPASDPPRAAPAPAKKQPSLRSAIAAKRNAREKEVVVESKPEPMPSLELPAPQAAPDLREDGPPPTAPPAPPPTSGISGDSIPNVGEAPSNSEQAGDDGPADDRPIVQRMVDSNWKVRKGACEALKAELATVEAVKQQTYAEYEHLLKGMVSDANASSFESGLDAIAVLVDKFEAFPPSKAGELAPLIIAKGFNGRPTAVKLSKELLIKFIEIGAIEQTFNALLEGVKDKKPKIPPLCVELMTEAFQVFGPRPLPLSVVKGKLVELLESTVPKVRPAAMSLLVELHRWVGPALLEDVVSQIRPAQKTEYQNATKDIVPGSATPTMTLRKDRGKRQNGAQGPPSAVGKPVDPREFADTVNLLEKLAKTDFKEKIAHPKWSEKVAGLQLVLSIIGPVPKLTQGEYGEFVNTVRLLLQDSNVQIQAKALAVFGALADGLRKSFSVYARSLTPLLLGKLSDKKSVIITTTNNTLDLFERHCVPLDVMFEEVKAACLSTSNKVPGARQLAFEFVGRCLANPDQKYDRQLFRQVGELLGSGLGDTDPKVRSAAVSVTAQYLKVHNSVDSDVVAAFKSTRSWSAIEQQVGGGGGVTATTEVGSKAVRRGSDKSTKDDTEEPTPATESSKRPAAAARGAKGLPKKVSPRSGPAGGISSKGKSSSGASAASTKSSYGGNGAERPLQSNMTDEEAEAKLRELEISDWEALGSMLSSAKWTDRKDAAYSLKEHCEKTLTESSSAGPFSEALVVFLRGKTNNFKESNINVLKAIFEAVAAFAGATTADQPFSKEGAGVICAVAFEKLNDKKATEGSTEMLLNIAESVGPKYVLQCLYQHVPTVKAPAVHAAALEFISKLIADFGAGECGARSVVDYVKGPYGLEASNPLVKNNAISLLGVLYKQMGPALKAIIGEGLKPALLSSLDSEFSKAGYDPVNALSSVKRCIKGQSLAAIASSSSLLERVDITKKISKDLLEKMEKEGDSKDWQQRLAAMEQVVAICAETGNCIQPTKSVGVLFKSLKGRLSDSNANLKVKAAQVIGVVAQSLGPDCARFAKVCMGEVLGCVSDNKKVMQSASIDCLESWIVHGGKPHTACFDSLMTLFPAALNNPVGRGELLVWMAKNIDKIGTSIDFTPIVGSLILCLQDKNAATRQKAQEVLEVVTRSVGPDAVRNGCRDVKPAVMRTLSPILEKIFANAAAAASNERGQGEPASAAPLVPEAADNRESSSGVPEPIDVEDKPAPASEGPISVTRKASTVRATSGMRSKFGTLKKPVSTAGVGAPGGTGSQPPPSAPTEVSNGRPNDVMMLRNNQKTQRLEKTKRNRWVFEDPKDEAACKQSLQDDWKPFISPDLEAKLFAPSVEKGILAGMDDLANAISTMPEEVKDSLDLVLKWCTLRMIDNNVQALARLLEIQISLFTMLKASAYELHDVEAMIFLPTLIKECGQQKPRFRDSYREVMTLISQIYPASKYSPYVMGGLTSKNTRTKSACLDFMGQLIQNFGYGIAGKKALKDMVALVDAPEKDVRESALSTMMAVYLKCDADVTKFYQLCPVNSQKVKDLLEQRMKHQKVEAKVKYATIGPSSSLSRPEPMAAKQAAPSLVNRPPPPIPAPVSGPEELTDASPLKYDDSHIDINNFSSTPQSDNTRIEPFHSADKTRTGASAVARQLELDKPGLSTSPSYGRPDDALTRMHKELLSRLDKLLVLEGTRGPRLVSKSSLAYKEGKEAIKTVHAMASGSATGQIKEGDLEGSSLEAADKDFLVSNVDNLLIKLTRAMRASFSSGPNDSEIDIYVLSLSLSAMVLLFKETEVAFQIGSDSLTQMLGEAIKHLVDPRLKPGGKYPEHAEKIVWALNKLAMQAAEKTDRTVSLVTLVRLLSVCNKDKENQDSEGVIPKITVKLLLLLMKAENQAKQPYLTVDASRLLSTIDQFYREDSKAQAAPVDPVRNALKHLLYSFVEALKNSGGTERLEIAGSQLPASSAVVEELKSKGIKLEGGKVTPGNISSSLHEELARIFKAISAEAADSPGSDQAIRDLYDFTKAHPEYDIAQPLSKASSAFQWRIKMELERLELTKKQKSLTLNSSSLAALEAKSGLESQDETLDRVRQLKMKLSQTVGHSSGLSESSSAKNLSYQTAGELRERLQGSRLLSQAETREGNTQPKTDRPATTTGMLLERFARLKK